MPFTVSTAWDGAIRSSGLRKTVVDLFYNGVAVAYNLKVSGGSVTIDRTQAIRRSCTIQLAEPDLIPDTSTDVLDPFGIQLRIRTGVVYSDGDEELIDIGRFYVDTAEWEEALYNRIPSVTGYDATTYLKYNLWWLPWDMSGKFWKSEIVSMITACMGWYPTTVIIDPSLPDGKLPGGTVTQTGSDSLTYLSDLVASYGGEMYADNLGRFIIIPIPKINEFTNTYNWVIDSGPNGVLVKARRSVTRQGVANTVIVNGPTPQSGTPQMYALAHDLDSRSKTFLYGPFGHSGKYVQTDKLTRQTDLQEYADNLLHESIALARGAQITCLSNPAMDVGDLIKVVYPDSTFEIHMVNSINLPLDGSVMTLGTKQKSMINN